MILCVKSWIFYPSPLQNPRLPTYLLKWKKQKLSKRWVSFSFEIRPLVCAWHLPPQIDFLVNEMAIGQIVIGQPNWRPSNSGVAKTLCLLGQNLNFVRWDPEPGQYSLYCWKRAQLYVSHCGGRWWQFYPRDLTSPRAPDPTRTSQGTRTASLPVPAFLR